MLATTHTFTYWASNISMCKHFSMMLNVEMRTMNAWYVSEPSRNI
jgi:hypothetical protein